jgi:hypothetical protein
MLYCQQCGAGNGSDARFCNQCGAKIASAGEPGGPIADDEPAGVSARPEKPAEPEKPPEPKAEEAHTETTMPGHGRSRAKSRDVEPVRDEPAEDAKEPTASEEPPREERASAPYPAMQQNLDVSTISLSAIGVRSRGKAWGVLIAAVLGLLGLGALGMWLAMSVQEGGGEVAQADETTAPDVLPPEPESGTGEIEVGDPIPEGTDQPDVITGMPRPRRTGEAAEPSAPTKRTPTPRPTPTEGGSVPEPWTNQPSGGGRPAQGTEQPSTGTSGTERPSTEQPSTEQPSGGGTRPEPDWEALEEEVPDEMDEYSTRVRSVIRTYYMRRAQTCFDMASRNNPSVRGTVLIGFEILSDGHVRNTSVDRNTTGIDTLGRCLATQVGSWQLPPPPDGSAPLAMQMPFSR